MISFIISKYLKWVSPIKSTRLTEVFILVFTH